ncbi:MAG: nicotinate phosphoribosyltransferase [Planctomycetota bacterium]|nr:MAG: nicotinate phosphoribosyltransferase [Planctomycetota bacterium]
MVAEAPAARPRVASFAMLTDLYELTMAYGYWREGLDRRRACFHLFFRKNPFGGGFALAAGLGPLIEALDSFRFSNDDLACLAELRGNDGQPLFEPAFLAYLGALRLECDIDAVPEGSVVFPFEPLVRVRGPLLQAQLLETLLLNQINFPTLVATKAARVCRAAGGDPVLEFGLRRAQGPDGGVTASRAAYVGGCVGTSNVAAGQRYGIPVRGTHAHSWVMAFATEREAFERYADAMPNNCIFLVDTYDTIEGVRNAIAVARRLRERGHELVGIRLDSGDLAALSKRARRMLDEAGFPQARIVASNELDEHVIRSLKDQGARIDVWGVGTKLATAWDQPALGGVYKLAAIETPSGRWRRMVKLSEQTAKISTPGILQVRRYERDGRLAADAIWDEELGIGSQPVLIDPLDHTRRYRIERGLEPGRDLLVPIYRGGERVYEPPALEGVRAFALEQLARLPEGVRRFLNPQIYPVGLEQRLFERKTQLILAARGFAAPDEHETPEAGG